jgi:hypothetical protein
VAADSFDRIADDIPKSCLRRVELTFEGRKVAIVSGQVEYSGEYIKSLATCYDLKNSLDGILGANEVLKGYAEALGELASDDVVTFTAELNTLRSNLNKVNLNGSNAFEGERADAVFNLARFLVNAAASGYRQRELKRTIEIGHQHIGPIIEGLIAVTQDYEAVLRNERLKIERVQIELVDEREKTEQKGALQDIDDKLFETKRMIESTEARDRAGEDYIIVLRKIKETHDQLYQSINELNSGLLISIIQDYSRQLVPLINNIREAYSG